MLKKKIVCSILAATLITATAIPAISFGGGAYAATTTQGAVTTDSALVADEAVVSPTADIIPITETKNLSLDQALTIMTTTGVRAETAALNKKADVAAANGYTEKVKTIKKALDSMDSAGTVSATQIAYMYGLSLGDHAQAVLANSMATSINNTVWTTITNAQDAGATSSNKKILQKRRDYALKYTDINYTADMNQIKQDTIQLYNLVLLAQDNCKIAKDNLAAQQKNLKTVNAKKEVGLLSKKDVLEAQSAVMDAEKEVREAETNMEYAHMSFNYLLGYNVMQDVKFTDTLKASTDPVADVNTAINNALENRNEIKGADMAVDIYGMLMDDTKEYSKTSSIYLNAQINLTNAQNTAKNAQSQIEIDMRNKAATVADKKAALDAAISLQSYANEGLRLVSLTYEEGLSTVQDLLSTQVSVYKANLNVSNATAEYNLALQQYEDAQGIGTMRIPL